jgi:small subunit ribosomal protein S10
MSLVKSVLSFRLEGYRVDQLELAGKKLNLAAKMVPGMSVYYQRARVLPTHRRTWTVNRSPFKHKKHRDTFEQLTHKRLLVFSCDTATAERFKKFAMISLPPGVVMKTTESRYMPLSFMYNAPEIASNAADNVKGTAESLD